VSVKDRVYVVDFDSFYKSTPPWDIGRPQKEFVQLEEVGEIVGSVLDVGCGTGENALFLASQGHAVWGIDFSPIAIKNARSKAERHKLNINFLIWDALDLHNLGKAFDTIIDSGLFHVLSDTERPLFITNLAAVLSPGGTYFMLCFSDLEPGTYGPRRVTQAEIRRSFERPWRINYIKSAQKEARRHRNGIRAWLSSISKE
jgi:2-polyprenyl-3-methyl-5-hydroxy-6-metoxy-1,4-benzoquinol methylase